MFQKIPLSKTFTVVISCGVAILISLFVMTNMPSIDVTRIQNFFSRHDTATCVSDLNIYTDLRGQFNASSGTVPFYASGFNSLTTEVKFSKKNICSTLSYISSMFRVQEVSCSAIFNGSKKEIDKGVSIAKKIGSAIPDAMYLNLTSDCRYFQAYRGYIMSSLTEEEKNFPLAFAIVVYTEVEMFERILRAIYRPQNYYCIHVDGSSSDTFFMAISSIANCFTNVFLSTKRIDVQWGGFSVLESELLCMEDLWRYPKWKYYFTLTGQEFPLKTNLELVKILTAYQGANDVMTTVKLLRQLGQIQYHFYDLSRRELPRAIFASPDHVTKMYNQFPPTSAGQLKNFHHDANKERWYNTLPPHGMKPVKGSVHIIVNRDYINYILHNETAKDLLNWTKSTFIPDETFFAILNANPQLGIRGTYKGEPEMTEERPFLARYKQWYPSKCAGAYVRSVCILTTGDLPLLFEAKQMIANKFFLGWDRVVIGCLEEKIFNDTRDGFLGTKTFNTSYYSNLDLVKNQVT